MRDAEEQRDELLREVEATRQAADAANRAQYDFLAMLSHKLREPLNAARTWIYLLRTGQLNGAAITRALDAIEASTNRQAQIIDELLGVSERISGDSQLDWHDLDLPSVSGQPVEMQSTQNGA